MYSKELEERVNLTRRAFEQATAATLIEDGRSYRDALDKYIEFMSRHPSVASDVRVRPKPAGASAAREQAKQVYQDTKQEHSRVDALLMHLTGIRNDEAIETMNQYKYLDCSDWHVQDGYIGSEHSELRFTRQQSVNIASYLRGETYIRQRGEKAI